MNSDIFIVVRTVGERSEELRRRFAVTQVGDDAVTVINERPFSEAVRVTFMRGIEAGRRWTLALDADILLHSRAIQRLLELASKAREDVFVVHKLLNLAG